MNKMFNIEDQYLELMNTVLLTGQRRKNRTGVDTLMVHGAVLRHNSACGFPLLTSKKVNFNNILSELLWFLSGSTDLCDLHKHGNHIWDKNVEDYTNLLCEKYPYSFTSSCEAGAIYGKQFRDFGTTGFDQITFIKDEIKRNPESRRLLVTAWDPRISHSERARCLPACHVLHQYDVDVENNLLNMTVYVRSGDLPVGIPYNIASYALMLNMMAQVTNYRPGMVVYFISDAHIYENHIDQCKLQLSRKNDLYNFSKLVMNKEVDDIFKFGMDDFKIENYQHHPFIKMEMVA